MKVEWESLRYALKGTIWELGPAFLFSLVVGYASSGALAFDPALMTLPFRIGLVAAVLAAGVFLTALKHYDHLTYGITELGFATTLTWRVVSVQLGSDSYSNGLALLAAAYLTTRGCQNTFEGGKKRYEFMKANGLLQ